MPASPLQYLPNIWGFSVWALGILKRTLHFREQQLEEILNHRMSKFSFCKEMDTCPSCPTSAFCFYKSVHRFFSLNIWNTLLHSIPHFTWKFWSFWCIYDQHEKHYWWPKKCKQEIHNRVHPIADEGDQPQCCYALRNMNIFFCFVFFQVRSRNHPTTS